LQITQCSLSVNPLPQPIWNATVVPFGDSFYLVGGQTSNGSNLNTIYLYNPDEDSWTLLDAKLKQGKYGVIAILIDKQLFRSE
jgi:N-acetylneuraminic acid mutarotase